MIDGLLLQNTCYNIKLFKNKYLNNLIMSDIFVSILIPIYNGFEFFNACIESIKMQDYNKYQVIVGINGHNKNSDIFKSAVSITKNVFSNAEDIIVLDLFNIKGKSNALNEMIKHVKHHWISILDVDDFWMPNKLSSQIPHTSDYDVIGTNCRYFGDLNISPTLPLGDINKFDFFEYNPIINSSCLIKKDLAFWDSEVDGVEDYDLWLKLKKQNKKFYNVPIILTMHRIHKQSAFNSKGNNLLVNRIKQRYI
jgi:glycosyltransferase involved in cell wall biosynthesis